MVEILFCLLICMLPFICIAKLVKQLKYWGKKAFVHSFNYLLDIYALNSVSLDNGFRSALTLCGSVSVANTAEKCSF